MQVPFSLTNIFYLALQQFTDNTSVSANLMTLLDTVDPLAWRESFHQRRMCRIRVA